MTGRLLPPVDEVLAHAQVVSVPLSVRFRGVRHREAVLLQGPAGWGEFAPFTEYPDDEAAWWLAAGLEAAYRGLPAPVREAVEVNATVPAVPADQVPDVLARFDGCTTVKIKVAEAGQSSAEDVARVARVREVLGASAHLRVDANGGWAPAEAYRVLSDLAGFGLQYAEQPCATVPELIELREMLRSNGIRVRLAADESIRKAADPLAVARTGAVDVAVVKVAPLGGVRRVLELAAELARLGVQIVVSSAIDTSVGLAAGVRAAACLSEPPLACGLATASLLGDDVVDESLAAAGGIIQVRDVQPDPRRLERLRAPAQRERWWQERVRRCHRLLASC
ncbi:MAG: o-succinylbenzoate synthase [Actinomycetales bacterium]